MKKLAIAAAAGLVLLGMGTAAALAGTAPVIGLSTIHLNAAGSSHPGMSPRSDRDVDEDEDEDEDIDEDQGRNNQHGVNEQHRPATQLGATSR